VEEKPGILDEQPTNSDVLEGWTQENLTKKVDPLCTIESWTDIACTGKGGEIKRRKVIGNGRWLTLPPST